MKTSAASSPLRQQIYQVVQKIPGGKVTTYGAIAHFLKMSSPRQVGQALHHNPDSGLTPCHRVVFSNGSTATGYAFGGSTIQAQLLKQEGVKFLASGRVDMKASFWQPGESA